MLSYHDFCVGHKGRALAAITANATVVDDMERQSRAGEPAVAAIDAAVAAGIGALDDTERQHAGRVVRDVLARRGWRPARRKRLRSGKVFASGAVYDRVAAPAAAPETVRFRPAASERIAAARALVASARNDIGTVDDFIAERRRDARREAGER